MIKPPDEAGPSHLQVPDSPLEMLAARAGWVPTGGRTMEGVTAVACICCHMPSATWVCLMTLEGWWGCPRCRTCWDRWGCVG